MPDTFGKRQRDALKTKRRQDKEEKRAARKTARQDPTGPPADEEAEDHQPADTADGQTPSLPPGLEE